MKICDLCREEDGTITESSSYCKSCGKDICDKHTTFIEGSRRCTNCSSEVIDDKYTPDKDGKFRYLSF